MGNVLFPEGVNYVIGDFTSLFGKATGIMLRNWCMEYGWPLVWSIGIPNFEFFNLPSNPLNASSPNNEAFFDPTTLSSSTLRNNVTFTAQTVSEFELQWEKTNATITETPSLQMNSTFWYSLWNDTITSIIPPSLMFNYQHVGDCSDSESCFGVSNGGDCFCPS